MHYMYRTADRGAPFRIRTLQPILSNRPLRRGRIQRIKARLRHRVWKITLVDTPFNLHSLSVGTLESHELVQFAALTGSQTDNALLQVQVRHLLDTWGSTLGSRFSTNKISMWYFRQVVSPDGPLSTTKAELRRTIRYAMAMDLCYLTPHGHDRWRSSMRALILREAPQWKQGVIWHRFDPTLLPFPTRN